MNICNSDLILLLVFDALMHERAAVGMAEQPLLSQHTLVILQPLACNIRRSAMSSYYSGYATNRTDTRARTAITRGN